MVPPQSGSRPSWASQDDYAGFNLIVIVLGSCIISYLLWLSYHAQISAFVMSIVHDEIRFIGNFTQRYDVADQEMQESPPSGVTFKDLYGIAQAVGMFFRIPAAGLIVVLAAVCSIRAAPSRYKRAFDLDGLIKEQTPGFPVISAFADRKLKLVAPNLQTPRPADYALTPSEWLACFATDKSGRFNVHRARAALAAQLGERWTGPENAAPAVRLLFIVFALHLAERRVEASRLLGEASACLADAKQDGENGPAEFLKLSTELMGKIDDFLATKLLTPDKIAALTITNRHAYATTALMALLTAARIKAGVLAPAQFLWLKLVDRKLWYALHSLGYEIEGTGRYIHPNPRIEALGARNHWSAERIVARPILQPTLDEATGTLDRYLKK